MERDLKGTNSVAVILTVSSNSQDKLPLVSDSPDFALFQNLEIKVEQFPTFRKKSAVEHGPIVSLGSV